ncbi:hypothetical protein [Novipirellula sp.]|uniref:hypothetical protein n=1 Tax=Novipirellula sp. TaxID=2795430 RepID=UPI003565B3FA
MSDEPYMLESLNDASRRVAVFEDDGTSAWLYLSGPNDRKPIADVWVHNRIGAPPTSEIKRYRGGPPPAASGFTDNSTICHDPDAHEWTFTWRDDGDAVALHCDGTPIAILIASNRKGWSRNLKRDGPWGNVWDGSLYTAIVQDGG